MKKPQILTNEQKEILKENFLSYPLQGMARIFGCGIRAVVRARDELRLLMPSDAPSDFEIWYFNERYPKVEDVEIVAVSLGRTKRTMWGWACARKRKRNQNRNRCTVQPLTPADEKYVVDHYKFCSNSKLADDLGKRKWQIDRALTRLKKELGLPDRKYARSKIPKPPLSLTPSQEQYLRRHYENGDLKTMSQELEMSQFKVIEVAKELGLVRKKVRRGKMDHYHNCHKASKGWRSNTRGKSILQDNEVATP